jgi:predicted aspartyl protease
MKSHLTRIVSIALLMTFCHGAGAQASSQDQFIEVSFDFYRNEVALPVKINGRGPFTMLLDTGTDPSAIDLALARELELKLSPVGKPVAGGGTAVNLAYATKLPLVEIGSLKATNITAAAIDLSGISKRMGKPIHGILGQSLLKDRIVQIDYPRHVVRFCKASPFPKGAGQPNTASRTVLHFRYAGNVLIDDVSVNGRKLVGNLDTGSDGTFSLTPDAASVLGLEDQVSKAAARSSVGYNGESQTKKGRVDNVTVGGIVVAAPSVIFFGEGTGHDKKPWGINIGNGFLKDFVVTIDYRSKVVTLERQ